jgi:hypothetical protein
MAVGSSPKQALFSDSAENNTTMSKIIYLKELLANCIMLNKISASYS